MIRCPKQILPLVALAALLVPVLACGDGPAPEAASDVSAASSADGILLRGRVLAADGEAPGLAHVHRLHPIAFFPEETLEVAADGRFEIVVPGDLSSKLRITATHHQEVEIPVVVTGDGPVDLDIHLAPLLPREDLETVRISGDWDDRQLRHGPGLSGAPEMERRPDGTFVYVVESPEETITYGLGGVVDEEIVIAGTGADDFVFEEHRGYRAVAATEDGRAEIVFDPAALPGAKAHGEARLVSADTALVRSFAIARAEATAKEVTMAALRDGDEPDRPVILAAARREILAVLDDTEAPDALRSYAAARLLQNLVGGEETPAERERAFAELEPGDPAWGFAARLLTYLHQSEDAARLEKLYAEHPDPVVRDHALVGLVGQAKTAGDRVRWTALHAELEKVASDRPSLRRFAVELDPATRVAEGEPLPAFEAELLDSGAISSSALLGRWTLFDFWGTWCAPCIGEMPHLHEAWERFGGGESEGRADFHLVSIAADDVEKVREFRDGDWPMPWSHVVVPHGDDIFETFEVTHFPMAILVDPRGSIVAVDDGLRGEELLQTLEKHLEEPPTAPAE